MTGNQFAAQSPFTGGGLSEAEVNALIAAYAAPLAHTHAAADIVSGTLDNARVNWAAPSAIGSGTPANGTFDALVGNSLTVADDTNATTLLGRARIDSRNNDVAYFSHRDLSSSANYALSQNASGETVLNAASGQALRLRINNSNVGVLSAAAVEFSQPLQVVYTDTGSSNVINAAVYNHRTSGTPAVGFGVRALWQLKSSTTNDREAGAIRAIWATATDANRVANMVLSVWNVGTETDVVTLTPTGISSLADTDASTILGRARIDSRVTDTAYFSHIDQSGSAAYALLQTNVGQTVLNAPTGQRIFIRNDGNNIGSWGAAGLFVGAGNSLPAGMLHVVLSDATTLPSVGIISHNMTDTPANNDGVALEFQTETSTTENTLIGRLRYRWTTITHASRSSEAYVSVVSAGTETDMVRITPTGIFLNALTTYIGSAIRGGSLNGFLDMVGSTSSLALLRTEVATQVPLTIRGAAAGQTADLQRWNDPSNVTLALITAAGVGRFAGLRLDVTPTAETPSATHTVTVNLNGTDYKLLCVAA